MTIPSQVERKLQTIGLALPNLPSSKGIYHACLETGGLLYVSGHVSVNADGSYITGKLGDDVSDEEGIRAARQCGLAMLASAKKHLGSLDRISRVVKLLGMVNAVPTFTRHALIMNGCSQLFVDLWGEEAGKGVRSAVGMGSLPNHVAVEIEGIFALHP